MSKFHLPGILSALCSISTSLRTLYLLCLCDVGSCNKQSRERGHSWVIDIIEDVCVAVSGFISLVQAIARIQGRLYGYRIPADVVGFIGDKHLPLCDKDTDLQKS